ncbi:MAG TPA: flagellar basal body protein FliL [Micromonospora sp.]
MSNYGPPGGPYPGQSPDPWQGRQPGEQYGQPADPWGGQDAGAPLGGSPAGYGEYQDSGGGYPGYGASQHPPTQRYESEFPQSGPGYPPPTSGPGYPPTTAGPTFQPGSEPVYHQPEPAYRPTGPDPVWSPSPAPPPKKSNTGLIALLVTLAVLVCGGGATALYLVGRDTGKPTADPTPSVNAPTGKPSAEPSGSASPDGPDPSESATATTDDAQDVKAGQCVKNEGTDEKPKLVVSPCTGKSYQVLRRFDGRITNGEEDAKTKCADVAGYTEWYFYDSDLDSLDFVLCLKKR